MTIHGKIRNEKVQYEEKERNREVASREAANMLALLSEKIDKYEHLTGEEILPSNQYCLLITS